MKPVSQTPNTRLRVFRALFAGLFLLGPGADDARGADWPMVRGDAERGSYTSEPLDADLSLLWGYRSAHSPRVAWRRRPRLTFDRVSHPVISEGWLFFGSSADGVVYALDAKSGAYRWHFTTDAPIRFAPAVADGRVFVPSDDGHLYALSARDGKLLWKRRAGPDPEMVLGNDCLVSRWVVRGGPAVRDDIVYFAAGIWPSEGVFVYALRAATGDVVWVNSDAAGIYIPQPHGTANAESGVSAQGYLVVTDDKIFLPTGRAVPAAFDRADGKFLYYHLQKNGHHGGAEIMATREFFLNGGLVFSADTGDVVENIGVGVTARLPLQMGIVHAVRNKLTVYRWTKKQEIDRKGVAIERAGLDEHLTHPTGQPVLSVLVAGTRVALGGHGSVTLLDLESGNRLASAEVDGDVYGLAAAAGRLYASTDSGHLYCFGAGRGEIGSVSYLTPTKRPFGDNELFARAAVEIVEKSGITAGYCVDLEAGDGALAFELARRTNLFIYAVEPDPAKVEVARQKLTAAGLYGSRVVVHERSPKATHSPRFFANLVVSGRSISAGAASLARTEAHRLQRPYGGVVCVGHPGAMEKHVRGALAGAGKWTHQYADPANTSCSGDPVRGPLRTLWYREIQQDLTQRHGRGPAPLFSDGRLFSEGLDSLVAVDAYNGRTLWEFPLPGILRAYHGDHLMGTSGTHGNYCVTSDGIYVRREDSCLRIDPTKGKLVGEFKVPVDAREEPLTWGYIACEGGVLFGTVADPEHVVTYRFRPEGGDLNTQLTESTTFFALDARTGALKWKYDAADSIRHNAIAIGGGRVYLIDRPPALFDRVRAPRPEQRPEDAKHETGVLKAFDAVSGELVWQLTEDVYGTLLALGVESNALLMSYQPSRFRLASEFGDRLTVVNATTGERLWEKTANYGSRPTLNNGIIYAQGGAWDLLTGEEQPFSFERSYGCGTLAAGRHLLVYRSATLGYFDVDKNEKNQNFGGMRPGCWINAIPAGGLVLVPDGSAGCVCSYQNKAWMALQGSE